MPGKAIVIYIELRYCLIVLYSLFAALFAALLRPKLWVYKKFQNPTNDHNRFSVTEV